MVKTICTFAAVAALVAILMQAPNAIEKELAAADAGDALVCIRGGDWNDADPFCYAITKAKGRNN